MVFVTFEVFLHWLRCTATVPLSAIITQDRENDWFVPIFSCCCTDLRLPAGVFLRVRFLVLYWLCFESVSYVQAHKQNVVHIFLRVMFRRNFLHIYYSFSYIITDLTMLLQLYFDYVE